MTEWVWIFLVFWVFVTVFGLAKKDQIVKMIAGFLGIMFGITFMSTSYLMSLGLILLNFYLLYEAIDE